MDLSNDLIGDYDLVEMLSKLTKNCAGLLDIASAGLLLSDQRGNLHLMASSSEGTRDLELFQLQRDEGPCLDCYRHRVAVVVPDLADEEQRWPQFCRAASEGGFRSVHALPMRLHDNVMGTLGLFGKDTGRLEDDDLALAQALVHVASVAIVNEKSAADVSTVNSQLQHALTSRIIVEQAKGVIAQTGGLDMDHSFAVLRRYARDHGLKLSVLAAEVVNRGVDGNTLIQHARSVDIV